MDRKAWIVVSICAILLALNLHYSGENAKIQREAKLAEQAEKEAQDAQNPPAEKPPLRHRQTPPHFRRDRNRGKPRDCDSSQHLHSFESRRRNRSKQVPRRKGILWGRADHDERPRA
jgi:hypothetical protein